MSIKLHKTIYNLEFIKYNRNYLNINVYKNTHTPYKED